jgi:hypothetical protein
MYSILILDASGVMEKYYKDLIGMAIIKKMKVLYFYLKNMQRQLQMDNIGC